MASLLFRVKGETLKPAMGSGVGMSFSGTLSLLRQPASTMAPKPECVAIPSAPQVLITHAAWNVIRKQMSKADYPVVQQIGLFKFELINNPIWVYEVTPPPPPPPTYNIITECLDSSPGEMASIVCFTPCRVFDNRCCSLALQVKELLSQPLNRTFGNPRGIQMVESGSNLNITPPPVKTTEGETEEEAKISRICVVALVLKPPSEGMDVDLPEAMSVFLYEQVCIASYSYP